MVHHLSLSCPHFNYKVLRWNWSDSSSTWETLLGKPQSFLKFPASLISILRTEGSRPSLMHKTQKSSFSWPQHVLNPLPIPLRYHPNSSHNVVSPNSNFIKTRKRDSATRAQKVHPRYAPVVFYSPLPWTWICIASSEEERGRHGKSSWFVQLNTPFGAARIN